MLLPPLRFRCRTCRWWAVESVVLGQAGRGRPLSPEKGLPPGGGEFARLIRDSTACWGRDRLQRIAADGRGVVLRCGAVGSVAVERVIVVGGRR